MNLNKNRRSLTQRPAALLLTASMAMPLFLTGCGGKKDEGGSAPPPPVAYSPSNAANAPKMGEPEKKGMSTGKKAAIVLVGAAAAYYFYQHHKKAEQNAQHVQYYISKSTGQIYYRDPKKNMEAVFVTPPKEPVQVDESEASQYSRFKGYNNQTTGDELQAASEAQ